MKKPTKKPNAKKSVAPKKSERKPRALNASDLEKVAGGYYSMCDSGFYDGPSSYSWY